VTEIEPRRPEPWRDVPAAATSAASRLVDAIGSIRSWTLKLALAAALAAAVLVYAIVRNGFPDGGMAILAVIGIIAATAPPLMLTAFWVVLGEIVRMPERLRRLPLEGREHGEQLRALLDQAKDARGRRLRLPRLLWRLTRVAGSARETLTPYSPLLPLLSVPFLAGTAIAAFAATIELVVAGVVAIVLAVG
jgi:hypothetical protein